MSKFRNFCFTFNNYTELNEETLKKLKCRYMVFGRETAPSTGTRHLQGYLVLDSPRTLASLGHVFPWHLEVAKGSASQNEIYCKKGGDWFEKGDKPLEHGGAMVERWDNARKAAEAGRYEDIPSDMYCRYISNFERIRTRYLQAQPIEALDGPCGLWYWGVPGAGKSYKARKDNPMAYIKNCNKWWDGYVSQDTVIMDELNPELAKSLFTHIKIWTDAYAFVAEVKGGSLWIRPKHFIITSNYSPEDCYEGSDLEAIKRRFKVTHFSSVFKK